MCNSELSISDIAGVAHVDLPMDKTNPEHLHQLLSGIAKSLADLSGDPEHHVLAEKIGKMKLGEMLHWVSHVS